MSNSLLLRTSIRPLSWYIPSVSVLSRNLALRKENRLDVRTLTTFSGHSVIADEQKSDLKIGNKFGSDFLKVSNHPLAIQVRGKKKKKHGAPKKDDSDDEDSDEDEEESADEILGAGYEDVTVVVPSLRLDNVLKASSKFARARIDEAFFESRIRVNEYKTTKKGEVCTVHDVIDYIYGRDPSNPEMITVERVEILNVPDIGLNTGKIKLKVRRFRNLIIANYPKDPYDGPAIYVPTEREAKS